MSTFHPKQTPDFSHHLRLSILVTQPLAGLAQDDHRVSKRKGSSEAKAQAQPEVSRDDSANEQRESKDKGDNDPVGSKRVTGHSGLVCCISLACNRQPLCDFGSE